MSLKVPQGREAYAVGEGINEIKRNFISYLLPNAYAGARLDTLTLTSAVYDSLNRVLNLSGVVDKFPGVSVADLSKNIATSLNSTKALGAFEVAQSDVRPCGAAAEANATAPLATDTNTQSEVGGPNLAAILIPSILGGLLLLGLLSALLCWRCKLCCFKDKTYVPPPTEPDPTPRPVPVRRDDVLYNAQAPTYIPPITTYQAATVPVVPTISAIPPPIIPINQASVIQNDARTIRKNNTLDTISVVNRTVSDLPETVHEKQTLITLEPTQNQTLIQTKAVDNTNYIGSQSFIDSAQPDVGAAIKIPTANPTTMQISTSGQSFNANTNRMRNINVTKNENFQSSNRVIDEKIITPIVLPPITYQVPSQTTQQYVTSVVQPNQVVRQGFATSNVQPLSGSRVYSTSNANPLIYSTVGGAKEVTKVTKEEKEER